MTLYQKTLVLLSCLVATSVTVPFAHATGDFEQDKDINIKICVGEGNEHDCKGLERKARVHVPPLPKNEGPTKVPLVLNIHALGSNYYLQQQYSGFDDLADREKIVVAYPNGFARARVGTPLSAPKPLYSFNAGGCCANACDPDAPGVPKNEAPIDDIRFFKELVKYIQDEMSKEHNFVIDPERIYATGMSNGGFMTNRVGCEMSDIVAAIVPVAGPLMNEAANTAKSLQNLFPWGSDPFVCNPGRPMPVLHFHSIKDPVVPFDGSKPFGFPTVDSSIEKWCAINGVNDMPGVVTLKKAKTKCTSYGPGSSKSVTLCEMDSPSHCWPGQGFGQCGTEVGNEEIWGFMKTHTLSGGFEGDTFEL